MIEHLVVKLSGLPVGAVTLRGELRSPEDWTFVYDRHYLASAAPVALSVSLPLRESPHVGAVARNWFCNLLPEGAVRDAIVARLRLPERDDFALLAAIGGECAGAVSLGTGEPVGADSPTPEPDLETMLRQATDMGGAWALLGAPLRLSLAGAQDKIPVVSDVTGLRLPAAGEPSTHILKPGNRRFRALHEMETLGLTLARAIGLETVFARPVQMAGSPALLIERYDRVATADGHTRRLHQEDFCQALGYPGELKYEAQGGPGLASCAGLVRRLGLGPQAIQAFLDWVIFNALIGNADAHAKNLALLVDQDGRRRLAPFYDLVPTIALSERLLDRSPALRIGNATRIDHIGAQDWREFARTAGYAGNFVLQRVLEQCARVMLELPAVCDGLVAQGCEGARIRQIATVVAENVERSRKAVDT